ncbi:MAG: hypothetical protein AB7V48_16290 [Sedimentibacter sp.]
MKPFKNIFKSYFYLLVVSLVMIAGFLYGMKEQGNDVIGDKIQKEIINNLK